jgi:branched-chain amino acid transport system permease protein
MDILLLFEQTLNGLQLGMMLFLIAAGLTLVLGIMNFINLAHGSFYMVGAFFAVTLFDLTDSFLLAVPIAFVASALFGAAVEFVALRALYDRDHLDQVLGTYGLILFIAQMTRIVWGAEPYDIPIPGFLSGQVELFPDAPYPTYRLAITGAAAVVGIALWWLIARTRLGMLIRAGASNREMVGALGVDIKLLCTFVFGLGAALAGLAGAMTGPILTVNIVMWESILILTFVVIIIGGIGSVRGALVAALLVGLVDTLGRFLLPQLFGPTTGPALSSMSIYILMAVTLCFRPQGLFSSSNA